MSEESEAGKSKRPRLLLTRPKPYERQQSKSLLQRVGEKAWDIFKPSWWHLISTADKTQDSENPQQIDQVNVTQEHSATADNHHQNQYSAIPHSSTDPPHFTASHTSDTPRSSLSPQSNPAGRLRSTRQRLGIFGGESRIELDAPPPSQTPTRLDPQFVQPVYNRFSETLARPGTVYTNVGASFDRGADLIHKPAYSWPAHSTPAASSTPGKPLSLFGPAPPSSTLGSTDQSLLHGHHTRHGPTSILPHPRTTYNMLPPTQRIQPRRDAAKLSSNSLTSASTKRIYNTLQRMHTPDSLTLPPRTPAESRYSFMPASLKRRRQISSQAVQSTQPTDTVSTTPPTPCTASLTYPSHQLGQGASSEEVGGKIKRTRTQLHASRVPEPDDTPLEPPNLSTDVTLKIDPRVNFLSFPSPVTSNQRTGRSTPTVAHSFNQPVTSALSTGPQVSYNFRSPIQQKLAVPIMASTAPQQLGYSISEPWHSTPPELRPLCAAHTSKYGSNTTSNITSNVNFGTSNIAALSNIKTIKNSNVKNTNNVAEDNTTETSGTSTSNITNPSNTASIVTSTADSSNFTFASIPPRLLTKTSSNDSRPLTRSLSPSTQLRIGSVMDILGSAKSPLPTADKTASQGIESTAMTLDRTKAAGVNASPTAATPVTNPLSRFARPASSWECTSCMLRNESSKTHCVACTTPKPGPDVGPSAIPTMPTANPLSRFARPASSWECTSCMLSNESSKTQCVACNTPKPGSDVVMPTSTFTISADASAPGSGFTLPCPVSTSFPLTGGFSVPATSATTASTNGFNLGNPSNMRTNLGRGFNVSSGGLNTETTSSGLKLGASMAVSSNGSSLTPTCSSSTRPLLTTGASPVTTDAPATPGAFTFGTAQQKPTPFMFGSSSKQKTTPAATDSLFSTVSSATSSTAPIFAFGSTKNSVPSTGIQFGTNHGLTSTVPLKSVTLPMSTQAQTFTPAFGSFNTATLPTTSLQTQTPAFGSLPTTSLQTPAFGSFNTATLPTTSLQTQTPAFGSLPTTSLQTKTPAFGSLPTTSLQTPAFGSFNTATLPTTSLQTQTPAFGSLPTTSLQTKTPGFGSLPTTSLQTPAFGSFNTATLPTTSLQTQTPAFGSLPTTSLQTNTPGFGSLPTTSLQTKTPGFGSLPTTSLQTPAFGSFNTATLPTTSLQTQTPAFGSLPTTSLQTKTPAFGSLPTTSLQTPAFGSFNTTSLPTSIETQASVMPAFGSAFGSNPAASSTSPTQNGGVFTFGTPNPAPPAPVFGQQPTSTSATGAFNFSLTPSFNFGATSGQTAQNSTQAAPFQFGAQSTQANNLFNPGSSTSPTAARPKLKGVRRQHQRPR